MKVSDYIVEFLISSGVTDIFGYPGGMVTGLIDSLGKRGNEIKTHLTYHEQGAAFAACGYAQAGKRLGVAFATSGPGATNLLTGVCNAYFDSIPVLFITGQVNTNESKKGKNVRQCGFQETDIISMAREVTKYAAYVEKAEDIRWNLEKAVYEALSERCGAVLLDIPMDVLRSEVDVQSLKRFEPPNKQNNNQLHILGEQIAELLRRAQAPVLLIGQGVKSSGAEKAVRAFSCKNRIPVVSSMIACDVMGGCDNYYGFVGAYGHRTANFIVAKSDLVLSLGSRMDIRQVGKDRKQFAPDAKIIRVDIDSGELSYKVHTDELSVCADVKDVLQEIDAFCSNEYEDWNAICNYIRAELDGIDDTRPLQMVKQISSCIPEGAIITTDVGQNQVWVAQGFQKKNDQHILFSGSNGAMGYSLPAAIGAAIETGKTVYSFNGDGGFQMNIQELQTIVREKLPIKNILFNNHALGMIRHFQEMYYERHYYMTVDGVGYSNPNFKKIAEAYNIPYHRIREVDECQVLFRLSGPEIVEVILEEDTYVYPKLEFGKPNQDQEPLLDRGKYDLLMNNEAIRRQINTEFGE